MKLKQTNKNLNEGNLQHKKQVRKNQSTLPEHTAWHGGKMWNIINICKQLSERPTKERERERVISVRENERQWWEQTQRRALAILLEESERWEFKNYIRCEKITEDL